MIFSPSVLNSFYISGTVCKILVTYIYTNLNALLLIKILILSG